VASWEANVGKDGEGRVSGTGQQRAKVKLPTKRAIGVSLWRLRALWLRRPIFGRRLGTDCLVVCHFEKHVHLLCLTSPHLEDG
jgi:hypothetical protein